MLKALAQQQVLLPPVQLNDQGLINTDPRFIAVPDSFINIIPTGAHLLQQNPACPPRWL